MIANIAPLIRLHAQADVFDYFVPKDWESTIKPGQLVKIPFRSSKVDGVILALAARQESKKFRARPIDSILDQAPVLTQSQLRLIKKFGEYYVVAPGRVARLSVPERPERASRAKPGAYAHIPFAVSRSQLPGLKEAAKRISQTRFLRIQDVSSFVWLLLHLIKHSRQSQL
ncbi:MAG: hypothetical protein HYW81_03600, partial [Parcubacteria group bacterium]|nr:hypothetical protein [Parcubacteria group bacterium]